MPQVRPNMVGYAFQDDRNVKPHLPMGEADRRRAIYEALRELILTYDSVVYFAKTADGLVKIGCTGSLRERRRGLYIDFEDILAVTPGDFDDERRYHEQFAEHLARGREWFMPAPPVVDCINEFRAQAGVPLFAP